VWLARLLAKFDLILIKYYIAPIEQSGAPEMYAKQQSFFDKLREDKKIRVIFGRLEKRKRNGKVYFIEKATDVNLALDLVLDAQSGFYDKAFLISNDGDFSGAVKAVINKFNKQIVYVAIGSNNSISHHLKSVSSQTIVVSRKFIEDTIIS
jgi:uncharacterized LabA/DUF88 family protein